MAVDIAEGVISHIQADFADGREPVPDQYHPAGAEPFKEKRAHYDGSPRGRRLFQWRQPPFSRTKESYRMDIRFWEI
ncbi:hypothetical protein [Maribacter antarcticus]|uniref:hypothetical protein n=1 Tax=Maribacter antarcticus TaxID=505250 RepID=UPI000AA19BED|nr:hypothetical protein [Maribacter antarcticus]